MKLILPFLETMATQACNLSCEGCTNYSDLDHPGYVTWADMKSQLTPWLQVLDIPDFGIIGGEPLLNPEIRSWLTGLRELMPNSQIRFTTNGLLLSRNLDLLDLAHDVGNLVFKITLHRETNKLKEVVDRIFKKFDWQPVIEHGINRWRTTRDLRLQINRPTHFIKTFQGSYADMMPYNSDPSSAFEICCQQTCPLLHNSKIYKCSTQGLLRETLARFNDPNIEQWRPYLVNGIGINETERLAQLVDNFGKPHDICQMCPSAPDDAILEHRIHVKIKNDLQIQQH